MKIFSSLILSLLLLGFWSCSDSGEPIIKGCMDSTACNYNLDATQDDASCVLPEDNYDCDNNCTAGLDACNICGGSIENVADCCLGDQVPDCAGTCGGSAVIDNCGVCDGNNSSCVNFSTEIQPIFTANCSGCHIASTRNNLSLSNYANIMLGNSDNGPVIIAGDHTNSLLWQYVNSGTMPPSGELTSDQVNLIETWIDEGASEYPQNN